MESETKKQAQNKFVKVVKYILIIFFVVSWLIMFLLACNAFIIGLGGLRDVSRRVTSPDQSKTALLERSVGFDLNFVLFIKEGYSRHSRGSLPRDYSEALWFSRDYNPSTLDNWHEDIEWSSDSSVIAVIIDGEYVFAYDFSLDQRYEDSEHIESLLKSRSDVHE